MSKDEIRISVGGDDMVVSGGAGSDIAMYGVGRKCRGKVVGYKPYGFFVETEDGLFGLVHGRNVEGWVWGERFDDVFPQDSVVDVVVVDVEAKTNRMSFSCVSPKRAPDAVVADDRPVEVADRIAERQEMAADWVEEHPDESGAAFDWLKAELFDGPMYGPLTHVLNDRFGVPVPVSFWIRLFPDFVCYSGKGDNPADLPAVALVNLVGDVAYWNKIKMRTDDLVESRNRPAPVLPKYGELSDRLNAHNAFPSAAWIDEYMMLCRGIIQGRGIYGARDVAERQVVPMLGQLGWDVSPKNAALVRGDGQTFDLRLYSGAFSAGQVSVAVLCGAPGETFTAQRDRVEVPSSPADRNVVERMLCYDNQLGNAGAERLVWTNGTDWYVLSKPLVTRRMGVIAERGGTAVLDALQQSDGGSTDDVRHVAFPMKATPFEWLVAFDELYDLIGK